MDEEDIWEEDIEYKDEGYIDLVLKVLAGMCDGQFAGLQVCSAELPVVWYPICLK